MTPALPVALVILTFLGAPAYAAPDFEPMLACKPDAHANFLKVKGFVKNSSPEFVASKREAFAEGMNSLTSDIDELVWPLANERALPTACRMGEEKVKEGAYQALSELRRDFAEKVQSVLPEDERESFAALTEKERAADALMGESVKSLAEFKSKAGGLKVGLQSYAGDGKPESVKQRAVMLAIRLTGFFKRARKTETAGGSAPGASVPQAVRDRETQNAAESKRRADLVKNGGFEAERRDSTPGAGAGAGGSTGGKISTGKDVPHSEAQNAVIVEGPGPDAGGTAGPGKKTRRPRVDPALENAIIEGGPGPDDGGAGILTEAVANSAKKPLGGVVNPPSAAAATSYAERKAEARRVLQTIADMPANDVRSRSEKSMAVGELNESRGFHVDVDVRAGEGVLKLTKNYKVRTFQIVNGKLPDVPKGDLTPEEEVALEWELEQLKRNKNGLRN